MRYGSTKHEAPVNKVTYDAVKKGNLKAVMLYRDPGCNDYKTITNKDVVELVCVNSKGLVEEFSPRQAYYVTYYQYLKAEMKHLEGNEAASHIYVVSLSLSPPVVEEDE